MNNINLVKQFAEKFFVKNQDSAHDFDHILRVYNIALKLVKNQKVDLEVIKIAVLLHDIGMGKEIKNSSCDHAIESAKLAKPFLIKLGLKTNKIQHILDCISSHRYRNEQQSQTLESKIVHDADKIDGIGAVGIARDFIWIGKYNAHIYKKINLKKYIKENLNNKINGKIVDKSKHSPQIEWEIKTKYIIKRLYTSQAKLLARKRLKYYKEYYSKLEREVKGLE